MFLLSGLEATGVYSLQVVNYNVFICSRAALPFDNSTGHLHNQVSRSRGPDKFELPSAHWKVKLLDFCHFGMLSVFRVIAALRLHNPFTQRRQVSKDTKKTSGAFCVFAHLASLRET